MASQRVQMYTEPEARDLPLPDQFLAVAGAPKDELESPEDASPSPALIRGSSWLPLGNQRAQDGRARVSWSDSSASMRHSGLQHSSELGLGFEHFHVL